VYITFTIPFASVTALAAESIPLTAAKLMVSPFTTLSLASVTVARMVLVLVPSADRLLGVAVITIDSTGPAMNVTVVLAFTPLQVALTVAVPRSVALVKVTVAIPLKVVAVAEDKAPAVVVKLTVAPSGISWLLVSLTVARMTVESTPSATMVLLPAVMVTDPTGTVVMVMLAVPDVPFIDVAVIVSVPPAGTMFGAVYVTDATPFAFVIAVELDRVPLTTANVMVSLVTGFPLVSVAVASTVLVLVAWTLLGSAATVILVTGPATNSTVVESLTVA